MEGKKTKIAIIGGGNMGGAITMALSKKELYVKNVLSGLRRSLQYH